MSKRDVQKLKDAYNFQKSPRDWINKIEKYNRKIIENKVFSGTEIDEMENEFGEFEGIFKKKIDNYTRIFNVMKNSKLGCDILKYYLAISSEKKGILVWVPIRNFIHTIELNKSHMKFKTFNKDYNYIILHFENDKNVKKILNVNDSANIKFKTVENLIKQRTLLSLHMKTSIGNKIKNNKYFESKKPGGVMNDLIEIFTNIENLLNVINIK